MKHIGIFYGSTTGNTKAIAERIQKAFGADNADIHDVASASANDLQNYLYLIFGTSTWGAGGLQDDWDAFVSQFEHIDLSGKKVALFGLGDQEMYTDTFVNGMGILYDALAGKGCEVVGSWPTDEYSFEDSAAIRDNSFVGLAIDEDNQSDITDERVRKWVEQIHDKFN